MSPLPALPDSADQAYIDQAIAKNTGRPGALLGILEAVQEHHPHKHLSAEALRCVAGKLDIPLSRIYSFATFYALFNLEPSGTRLCEGGLQHPQPASTEQSDLGAPDQLIGRAQD
jgi:NADH:ubiquinone oxidoreductase subunit E